MSAADRLRAMVEAATPGPWLCIPLDDGSAFEIVQHPDDELYIAMLDANDEGDARLIALTPEVARWAADAAKMIRDSIPCYGWRHDHTFNHAACNEAKPCHRCALLVRLAGIVGEPE